MARFGWVLALLLVAAGSTPDRADAPVSSTTSASASASASAPTSSAPSVAPLRTAGSSPARRTTARSSSARPSAAPSAVSSTVSSPSAAPPVSTAARAAGLLDIRTIVPDAVIDLRYATSHNFVGVRLYPADARCLVHESMAPGLKVAADRLRRQGLVVVFWDCYRPHAVQVRMFQIVSDPNWVARPGPYARSHEAGRSVDITLAHAGAGPTCPAAQRIQGHCLLDMSTGFDDFTARAHAFATYRVSSQAQANRARLRSAMGAGGIVVYSGEWWHFDGPGATVGRPHLNAPVD